MECSLILRQTQLTKVMTMARPDLNLLTALDALLQEGSVAGAARRMWLSPSAMSRALTRLRETTGDPLLVRAGRALVPTPRAVELRSRVGLLVEEAEGVLSQQDLPDLASLDRTFTLRVRDGFVESFGAALLSRVARDAPFVRLRFVPKSDKDSAPLRDGLIDLDTGVIGPETGPEIRAQALFHDRFVGAVRKGHPILRDRMTPSLFSDGRHVAISRRGEEGSRVDALLAATGHARRIAAVVGEFAGALAIVRGSDLIAIVPERQTAALRDGVEIFPLPFEMPGITVSLFWHPRMEADPPHRWLRDCVRQVCTGGSPVPDI